jgi:ABC-type nitrate/sulfonate/bicarbonate transport system substrate-binding protein
VRLGFVALADCAPLIMAQELGLFEKYGVAVELSREIGWATVRDKILYRELDAAQAPAGLMLAASAGLGCIQADLLTGLVLNLHGNALTFSEQLWSSGVRGAASLQQYLQEGQRRCTLGVAHTYSSHSYLLRNWLRKHHIDPDRDVQIVTVPPAQMVTNLREGNLDGYCVGEPWNSMAVLSRIGWCAATSVELSEQHIEKVLMVQCSFAETAKEEHLALIAALVEACRFCDRPENRERIIETLALPHYVGAPIQALRSSLGGLFDYGHGRIEKHRDLHVFSREDANEPTPEKARGVLREMIGSGLLPDAAVIEPKRACATFRQDIYLQATQLITQSK